MSQTFLVQADPDPQTRRRKIHCKQELIIASLQRFYNNREDIEEIFQILQGTSVISLRLIDWFVTNYAKTHSTSYILNNQQFLVYVNYKSQLKAYSKKLFDPFCRRERILFQILDRPSFLTTVGKLNFFRWAIEKGILNYIRLNLDTIEKEMNTFMRETQKIRKTTPSTSQSTQSSTTSAVSAISLQTQNTKSSTRRRIINKETSSVKIMHKHDVSVEVSFD